MPSRKFFRRDKPYLGEQVNDQCDRPKIRTVNTSFAAWMIGRSCDDSEPLYLHLTLTVTYSYPVISVDISLLT
jgi:hypothetical protein